MTCKGGWSLRATTGANRRDLRTSSSATTEWRAGSTCIGSEWPTESIARPPPWRVRCSWCGEPSRTGGERRRANEGARRRGDERREGPVSGMTGRASSTVSSVAAVATLALCLAATQVGAGTTGTLSGVVQDGKKQPLAGANVTLPELRLGGVTDASGRYTIFNVPAGTYTVKMALLGYAATIFNGVAVPADRTTTLHATLP